jgi:hypothetical protein
MARKTFDNAGTGELHTGSYVAPRRNACYADGCPMAGAIFTGGTNGPGVCAYHYGVKPHDVPRVTSALREWDCVAFEVREARRALTGDAAFDPKAMTALFTAAWQRLKPLVHDYAEQLQPGRIRVPDSEAEGGYRYTWGTESYADWAKRLEQFLGARIVETLRGRIGGKV